MGSFVDKNTVSIKGEKNEKILGEKRIIATGSKKNYFRGMEQEKKRIINARGELAWKECNKDIIEIGGGVSGMDIGYVDGGVGGIGTGDGNHRVELVYKDYEDMSITSGGARTGVSTNNKIEADLDTLAFKYSYVC